MELKPNNEKMRACYESVPSYICQPIDLSPTLAPIVENNTQKDI